MLAAPTLTQLSASGAVFNTYRAVDATWLRFVEATAPAPDLARPAHRAALLRWLNAWGCRIRYPRPGEPDVFDDAVAGWWDGRCGALPTAGLTELTDAQIDLLADAYAALAATPVTAGPRARTLGPTAAAKALYALRPAGVMPWDAAIATSMYGARDGAAFGRHLRTGRGWGREVLAEAGVTEAALPALVGRPAVTLAKVLDEFLYVTITRSAGEGRQPEPLSR